jgi:hypothetical protein
MSHRGRGVTGHFPKMTHGDRGSKLSQKSVMYYLNSTLLQSLFFKAERIEVLYFKDFDDVI